MSIFNRVMLKDMTEADLPLVLSWRNKDHVRNMMYNNDIITIEQHVKWFETIQKSPTSLAKVFYVDERPYGVVNIHQIDHNNYTCEWGIYIGEENTPAGLGTVMGYLAIQYIFFELRLKKIHAEVLAFNQQSYYYHKKMGFEQKDVLKKHIRPDGTFIDTIVFSLTITQWEQQREAIQTKIEQKFKENHLQ